MQESSRLAGGRVQFIMRVIVPQSLSRRQIRQQSDHFPAAQQPSRGSPRKYLRRFYRRGIAARDADIIDLRYLQCCDIEDPVGNERFCMSETQTGLRIGRRTLLRWFAGCTAASPAAFLSVGPRVLGTCPASASRHRDAWRTGARAGLCRIPLRQSGCAQGRPAGAGRTRHLRQPQSVHRQGARAAAVARPRVRKPAGARL